eukprot:12690170-Alexandrium_andersonii.AAC.1
MHILIGLVVISLRDKDHLHWFARSGLGTRVEDLAKLPPLQIRDDLGDPRGPRLSVGPRDRGAG